jgi:thiol-disulfide isomerase/thioredoxin
MTPALPRRTLLASALLTRLDARAQRAPALELQASDGAAVLAESIPWKCAYLDFWASWCAPCRLSFPWMNEMHDRYAAAGLRIVAINLDRKESDARRFLAQLAPRFPIALDPLAESARKFDVQAMPTSVLVARDRSIAFVHRGFRLEDRGDLEARLRKALA